MSEQERARARIIARLAGSDDTHRRQLAELAVERALSLRLREVVDILQLRAAVTQGLNASNLKRVVDLHVAPGFERYTRAVAADAAVVGSLVSPAAHQKLHAIARKWHLPRARWADRALDPGLVKQLLRPVWTQVLLNFAKRLPIPGVSSGVSAGRGSAAGGGGTIAGFLTRSVQERASSLIDRGKTAIGGIGAEVERRLSAAARDFSDSAAQAFREALLERLQSEEGRELVGQILAGFTDHILRTRFADLHADAERAPIAEIFDLVPDLVSFAARSDFVQSLVTRELSAWMELHGERTLGELLQDYGLADDVRPTLVKRVEAVSAGLVATPAFEAWLAALLRDDADPE